MKKGILLFISYDHKILKYNSTTTVGQLANEAESSQLPASLPVGEGDSGWPLRPTSGFNIPSLTDTLDGSKTAFVNEDTNTSPVAPCQLQAAASDQAPPADPLNKQGALQLCSRYKEEHTDEQSGKTQGEPFPLYTITGFNLAQGKIVYPQDVQRLELAIEVEKEREKQ